MSYVTTSVIQSNQSGLVTMIQSGLATKLSYADGLSKLPGGSYAYRDIKQACSDEIDNRLVGLVSGTTTQSLFSSINHSGTGSYVRSTTHFCRDLDLSCISIWNSGSDLRETATLISPRHVLLAQHYWDDGGQGDGRIFRWKRTDGTITTRILSSSTQVGSTDIRIGLLDADVTGIRIPKVFPSLIQESKLVGAPVIYTNQDQKLSVGQVVVANSLGLSLGQSFSTTPRHDFFTSVITGDSSHPILAIVDGELVLLGSFELAGTCPLIGVNYNSINSAMTSLGGGYQLTPLKVAALGTASLLDTSFTPTNGQIPIVDSNGYINPAIIPDVITNQFGLQSDGRVLASAVDPSESFAGTSAVSFRRLQVYDLPNVSRGSWGRSGINDSNVDRTVPAPTGFQWEGISTIAYTTLTAPRSVKLPIVTTDFSLEPGKIIVVQDETGNCSSTTPIVLNRGSANSTIEGANSVQLTNPREAIILQFTELSRWKILGRYNSSVGGVITWPGAGGAGSLYSGVSVGAYVSGISNYSPVLSTQSANTVFAGPSSGGAATPTFRALAEADIPAFTYANAPNGAIFTYTSQNLDFKTVSGTTDLFTVPASKTFVLVGNNVLITQVNAATHGGAFKFQNDSGFDLTSASTTTTTANMNVINKYYSLPVGGATAALNNYYGCAPGTKVQFNLTQVASATSLVAKVGVTGYYIAT